MSIAPSLHRPWLSKTWTGRTRNGRPVPGAQIQWQAKCACGLRGEIHNDRDGAGEEAQQHVDGAS